MASEITKYVNTDVVGGAGDGSSLANAYSSLNACEAAEETDLVTADNWMHIYHTATSGTADSTATIIGGWDTSADCYILVEAMSGHEAVKTSYDTSRTRLQVTDPGATGVVGIQEQYVRFLNMQMYAVYSSTNSNVTFWISGVPAGGSNIRLDNCRIRNTDVNGIGRAIELGDADASLTINNCIVEFSDRWILYVTAGTNLTIYNSIFAHQDYATGNGIYITSGSITTVIKNTVVFDSIDDFDDASGATIDYCASDDGDGTHAVAPSGGNWSNEFSDPVNGDWAILTTGNLYQAGVGPGTDANVPNTDIDGDSRSGASCDIGVDEYAAAGATVHNYFYNARRGK